MGSGGKQHSMTGEGTDRGEEGPGLRGGQGALRYREWLASGFRQNPGVSGPEPQFESERGQVRETRPFTAALAEQMPVSEQHVAWHLEEVRFLWFLQNLKMEVNGLLFPYSLTWISCLSKRLIISFHKIIIAQI